MILQEIGQANDTPDDIIFDHFQEVAFPDQPIGRPVLGSEDGIRAMPRATLTGYMRRHYPASNVVVAAAGALHHDDILDLVNRHFADLPGDPLAQGRGRRATAAANSARRATSTRCTSCWASRRVGYGDPDYYPTLLLSTLLGGGMSSRLFQEVREKRGLVYSIYSFSSPFMDGGLFGIYAGTGESEAAELMPVTLEELHKVQVAVTEAELARARAQVKAQPADVAGEHRQPLRAACPAVAGVRPGDPDGGDGGEDQRGDHGGHLPRRGAHLPRRADAGDARPGRAGAGPGRGGGAAGGVGWHGGRLRRGAQASYAPPVGGGWAGRPGPGARWRTSISGCPDPFNLAPVDQCVKMLFEINRL